MSALVDYTEDKPDLLLLHGYLADSRIFFNQVKFFKQYFTVYAPDLRGFGTNADMPFPYSLSDYVNETIEFLERNKVKKPHVIAHSFGGRIVLKASAENPKLFNKIVLTGSAGLKPKFSFVKCAKRTTFRLLKTFIDKNKLSAFYSKDYNALSPLMRESFKKIVSENLDGYLSSINNKTLIIFGDKDSETPPYMAKRLHKGIKGSKILFLKDCGHFCFMQNPYKFNMEVREFLLS